MIKKFVLLIAALALFAVPVSAASAETYNYDNDTDGQIDYQQAEDTNQLSIDVLAAIEVVANDNGAEFDEAAPGPGATAGSASIDTSAALRSNLAWEMTSALSGGSFNKGQAALLVSPELNGEDGDVADSGSRNQNTVDGANGNDPQVVNSVVDQEISWGDEAGNYTSIVTHTATQDLAG